MSSPIDASLQPESQGGSLESVARRSCRTEMTPGLWGEIHRTVQEELARIEPELRSQIANVVVRGNCTRGENFLLFTFRTFSRPGSNLDPVVVGMTFASSPGGVTVEADISGEETGDILLSLPFKTVPNSREELIGAAQQLAREL